jgi:hypothetical protein
MDGPAIMPNEPDDLDEPDFRQPVVDVDVEIELNQLRGTVEGIAHGMENVEQELDRITRTLNECSNTLRGIEYSLGMFLGIIILGIAIIVGTLRHWF